MNDVLNWVVYPEQQWQALPPEEAGFTPEFVSQMNRWQPEPYQLWGERVTNCTALLTRGGYLVRSWGNIKSNTQQIASAGKAFTIAALGLAVEKLGLNPDEPVCRTWTGAGQVSHRHKRLDHGSHRAITWRHLVEHTAGFAIENAWWWREGIAVPSWVRPDQYTGNPLLDMRSFREPGTTAYYSSAHFVRLGQALTALWGADLKEVVDREILGPIGITPDRWNWMTLSDVYQDYYLYPETPGYGQFVDPPYEISGKVVRGGPGWVRISAEDLARFGLLVATGGVWKGERLLSPQWLVSHSGGNRSAVLGCPKSLVAVATVTAGNLPQYMWDMGHVDQWPQFVGGEAAPQRS